MTLISAATGRIPVDTLISNVRIANVITGEIYPADIAIYAGKIAAVEAPGTEPKRQAKEVIDGEGRLAVPGLIDAHLHIESTLVTPAHFAESVLPLGTTTVAEDPHEVANVSGIDGIRTMMAASANIPLKVEYLISSSVPSLPGLETAGGVIGPAEIETLLAMPHVLGLAEVMDGASVVAEDPHALSILAACGGVDGQRVDSPGVIEGHNPMLRGRALSAFIAAGVDSDHTLATPADLVEKARQGVTLMLQERYLSTEVIAALEALPLDTGLCLITDDVAPDYMLNVGHLDQVLRRVIALGMEPMRALRAATFNPARRLRLFDRGALTPGRAADIVLIDSIEDFRARLVMVDGRVVAEYGRCLWRAPDVEPMNALCDTVQLGPQQTDAFVISAPIDEGELSVRIIDCVPGQTLVTAGEAVVPVREGRIELTDDADMAYISVVDRHSVHGGRSFGIVRGLGLHSGALATTYAHDSHNLAVIGRSAAEMTLAANAVINNNGGIAVVDGEQVSALLSLPIAGIISDQPVAEVAEEVAAVGDALRDLGLAHPYWLMRISTFTLPVSSGLRITDLGLVDAAARQLVPLEIGDSGSGIGYQSPSPVQSPTPESLSPIPVILDVDTGTDDALALLLALRSPRLDVRAISCVAGNHGLKRVVDNTLKVLDLVEAPHIPVAAGMERPLVEAMRPPSHIHGYDGMADLGLPPTTRKPVDLHAVELLRRTIVDSEEPLTLIALAPLTNVAALFRMYPDVAEQLAGLTIMGGAYIAHGNTSPTAEFNIRSDPEAAAIVLESGLPIRLYPLDVFRELRFNRTEIEQFIASADPAAQMAGRILRFWCDHTGADSALIGDAGAVATVIDPGGAMVESAPATVALSGEATRGQTVLDRRPERIRDHLSEWWHTSSASVDVIAQIDLDHYRTLFADAIGAELG